MLKTFTGFRGVAALAELDKVQFVIIAHNAAELEVIYSSLLPNAPAFNPDMCQKSVMIQAGLLPEPAAKKAKPAEDEFSTCPNCRRRNCEYMTESQDHYCPDCKTYF